MDNTAEQRENDGSEPTIAAAIITRDDCVLLVRRRIPEGELVWQFPAGKVEPGETPEQAAVRETFEETGLVVTALRILGQRVHPLTNRHIVYVLCVGEGGTATAAATDEVVDIAWSEGKRLADYVPRGIYPPVQAYLNSISRPNPC